MFGYPSELMISMFVKPVVIVLFVVSISHSCWIQNLCIKAEDRDYFWIHRKMDYEDYHIAELKTLVDVLRKTI